MRSSAWRWLPSGLPRSCWWWHELGGRRAVGGLRSGGSQLCDVGFRAGPGRRLVTHAVVVAEIMARASRLNVLSHYCGRSQLCQGDRGLPDLLCVGLYFGAFIEV